MSEAEANPVRSISRWRLLELHRELGRIEAVIEVGHSTRHRERCLPCSRARKDLIAIQAKLLAMANTEGEASE